MNFGKISSTEKIFSYNVFIIMFQLEVILSSEAFKHLRPLVDRKIEALK